MRVWRSGEVNGPGGRCLHGAGHWAAVLLPDSRFGWISPSPQPQSQGLPRAAVSQWLSRCSGLWEHFPPEWAVAQGAPWSATVASRPTPPLSPLHQWCPRPEGLDKRPLFWFCFAKLFSFFFFIMFFSITIYPLLPSPAPHPCSLSICPVHTNLYQMTFNFLHTLNGLLNVTKFKMRKHLLRLSTVTPGLESTSLTLGQLAAGAVAGGRRYSDPPKVFPV